MRWVRGARIGTLVVAVALLAAACGGGSKNQGSSSGGGGNAAAKKVGVVFDIGGKGDKSFNDSADRGATEAKQKYGDKLDLKEVEPNPDGSNRKELLDGLASSDYGLVFGVGFLFSEDIAKSAKENTDVTYAVIDGFDPLCTQNKNLLCIGFKEQEGSFLVGAAAALKSKTHTVGFVGGQLGALIQKFQAGYQAGIAYIDKQKGTKTKVLVDYAGTTGQAFRDPAKGKELALKQIGQGADVIYHASGLTGTGVIAAAASKQKYAIGVDSDQSLTASPAEQKWILTSMIKRVDNAVSQTIGKYEDGSLKGGIETFGLKEGGVDYAQNKYNKALLGDIPTTLDQLKQKIISGEIQVPDKPASS
jgi:basic membrane protein A and related proteins